MHFTKSVLWKVKIVSLDIKCKNLVIGWVHFPCLSFMLKAYCALSVRMYVYMHYVCIGTVPMFYLYFKETLSGKTGFIIFVPHHSFLNTEFVLDTISLQPKEFLLTFLVVYICL